MENWRAKLVLQDGEELKPTGSKIKGFMGETDVNTYDVVDAEGTVTGSVTVEDHTAVKGFKRTISVDQRNAAGETVMQDSWVVRN